jgi:hypothetical protein
MKPAYTLLALGFLALAATASAGPLDDPHTSGPPAMASGVYSVSFHLNSATSVPTGATLTCKAKVVPSVPGAPARNVQPVVGIGTPGGCALEVPYAWSANQAQAVASLDYEIDAVSNDGAVVRSTGPRAVRVAAPPAGGTAQVNLSVPF